MELSGSKIKKFLVFSQKKAFLIFLEIEPCTFQPKLEKISYTLILKKFLTFSQKKAVPIFQETKTLKKFFIFQEAELSYISGGTSKAPKSKISYISPKTVMNKFFQRHFGIIVSIFSIY